MTLEIPQLNLLLAWAWFLAGFVSGALLGAGFQREEWLGGYSGLKRRLYRLGHISFFGLGTVNLMFFLTVKHLPASTGWPLNVAAWSFVAGAILMPVCCLSMAHLPKTKFLFVLPVTTLFTGALLTLMQIARAS